MGQGRGGTEEWRLGQSFAIYIWQIYTEVLLCWMHICLQLLYFLLDWFLITIYCPSLSFTTVLILKSIFIWYDYCCSSFLLISICMNIFLHPLGLNIPMVASTISLSQAYKGASRQGTWQLGSNVFSCFFCLFFNVGAQLLNNIVLVSSLQ